MKIGILEIVSQKKNSSIFSLKPYLVSFMPQCVAVWCEEFGHKVHYQIITNSDVNLEEDLDIIFISSYTMTAYLAYCISAYYKSKNKIIILGGPHARSYPKDSIKYFDYVVGLADKNLIKNLLENIQKNVPGIFLSNSEHPVDLPSVQQRWKYIEAIFSKGIGKFLPYIVPLISSTGCPYNCEFCVDADLGYQVIDYDKVKKDVTFLSKQKRAVRGIFYDPNFGVRFKEIMDVLDPIKKSNTLKFGAELNIKGLTEDKLKRLKDNNFYGIAPGIESWFAYDKKSVTKHYDNALDKVYEVSEHFKLIVKYLPLIQVNIIFGLDGDGLESFDLTKKFIEITPEIYANYQTLTIFGEAAPIYNKFKEDRIISLPYNLMDGYSSTNAKLNTNLIDFYSKYSALCDYSGSWSRILKKIIDYNPVDAKVFYLLNRSMIKTAKYYKNFSNNLKNYEYENFYNGASIVPPIAYHNLIKEELGKFYQYLPQEIKDYFSGE